MAPSLLPESFRVRGDIDIELYTGVATCNLFTCRMRIFAGLPDPLPSYILCFRAKRKPKNKNGGGLGTCITLSPGPLRGEGLGDEATKGPGYLGTRLPKWVGLARLEGTWGRGYQWTRLPGDEATRRRGYLETRLPGDEV